MTFIKIIIIAIILVGISILGLALKILIKKNGSFPQHSVGKNKKMKELGIKCARSEEIKCRKEIDNPDLCDTCTQL